MKHIIELETEDGSQAESALELLRGVSYVKAAELRSAVKAKPDDSPTSDDDAVVDWYALRMKQKLAKRSTDATKGVLNWRSGQNSLSRLYMRLMMEVGELSEVLFRLDEHVGTIQSDYIEQMEKIIDESVDVGAMAMMIADFAKMVQDDAS